MEIYTDGFDPTDPVNWIPFALGRVGKILKKLKKTKKVVETWNLCPEILGVAGKGLSKLEGTITKTDDVVRYDVITLSGKLPRAKGVFNPMEQVVDAFIADARQRGATRVEFAPLVTNSAVGASLDRLRTARGYSRLPISQPGSAHGFSVEL